MDLDEEKKQACMGLIYERVQFCAEPKILPELYSILNSFHFEHFKILTTKYNGWKWLKIFRCYKILTPALNPYSIIWLSGKWYLTSKQWPE